MKERRYKKAYRIVTDVDPKTGKPRETAVYAGDYYRFPADTPAPKRRALPLALLWAAYWLCALLYLRFGVYTSRCAYALLPFMVGALPGVYGLMGLFSLFRAPERMTVVQRENGPGRLVRAALGCAVFSAAGALGCAVFLTLNRLWPAAWTEPALCAAAALAASAAFARARRDDRALVKE